MNLKEKKKFAKNWIDQNVHDGEDRSGAKGDWSKFTPDELQKLINDLLIDMEWSLREGPPWES